MVGLAVLDRYVVGHVDGDGQGRDRGGESGFRRVVRVIGGHGDGFAVVDLGDAAAVAEIGGIHRRIRCILELDGIAAAGVQHHLADELRNPVRKSVEGHGLGNHFQRALGLGDLHAAVGNAAFRLVGIQGVVLKEIFVFVGDLHAVIAYIDCLAVRELVKAVLPVEERDFVIRSSGQGLAVERHRVHEFIRRMARAVVGEVLGVEFHLRLRLFDGELLAIVDVITEVAHNGTFSRACIEGIPVELPGGNVIGAHVGMTAVVEGNIHTLQRSRSRGLHLVAQVIPGMPQGIAGIIRFAIYLAEVTELNFHVE